MQPVDSIHWYITGRCNTVPPCTYCFKPSDLPDTQPERMQNLAEILSNQGVKKVTITGGEPLLVRGLESILEVLKRAEVYVSLHTNGTLLNQDKLAAIADIVDDIALPIDTTDRRVQRKLRGNCFLPTYDNMLGLADRIRQKEVGLGYHTVFTALNHGHMQSLYNMLNKTDFQYWKVYEVNLYLPRKEVFREGLSHDERVDMWLKINELEPQGTPEKGYTDCLFAYFLLEEEGMRQHGDARIQFVRSTDALEPYLFLDNSGDVNYYTWYSYNVRHFAGNLFADSLQDIRKKCSIYNNPFDDNAPFFDDYETTISERPIWARLWDGFYIFEELEDIHPDYYDLTQKLAVLYESRLEKKNLTY